jgi:hypothetical protein
LGEKLAHLTYSEKSLLEFVLCRFSHAFHEEGTNEFKGTDLLEHQIIPGEPQPISRPQYRVQLALIKGIEIQIHGIIMKVVIRESQSPRLSAVVLVLKM